MGAPKDQDQMININIILPNLLNALISTGEAEGAGSVALQLLQPGSSAASSQCDSIWSGVGFQLTHEQLITHGEKERKTGRIL